MILVVLAVATVASVIKARNDPEARAHAGSLSLRERREKEDG